VILLILLSIGYSKNNNSLYDKFKELCDYIRGKGSNIAIVENDIGNMHYLKCILKDTEKDINNFENCREIFYSYSSNIIYSFISMEYETELVEKLLKDNYNYLDPQDYSEIRNRCMSVISGSGMFTTQGLMFNIGRRNNILKKIDEFLAESAEMILDGFITFRLREANHELNEVIEKITEDYVMEKEYSEFIRLLKYFVDIQESKYEEINIVILANGEFKVEDNDNKDITDSFFEDFSSESLEGDINKHDMLISALITNAPKKIIIHGIENDSINELIETIKSIFLDRITICTGCERCNAVRGNNLNK
jgi:putative sporulation protein YtxC